MKINFIVDGIYESGGMKVIFEYADRLLLKGHDVVLYTPIVPYNFNKAGFEFFRYAKLIKNKAGYYLRHKSVIIDKYKPEFKIKSVLRINNKTVRNADVTIATRWPTAYSVSRLDVSKGKKVYFIQGYENWDSDVEMVDGSYRLDLCRIVNSGSMKDLLRDKFDAGSEVVLNGIDFSTYYNDNKTFNIERVISFIDRSQRTKGIEECLEVINMLNKKYKNLKFKCFSFRKYHDIPSFIEFHDKLSQEEIRNIYCDTDIFLFPSLEEGFGLPPAEAMACKCAVVSTKVGAVCDYSEDNVSALHVTPGDVKGMFDAVSKLIDDDELLKKLSMNGFKMIRERLDWNRSVSAFEKILLN